MKEVQRGSFTKSEKTAPIDMLRTISSSSSVSDIVLVDDSGRQGGRQTHQVLLPFSP